MTPPALEPTLCRARECAVQPQPGSRTLARDRAPSLALARPWRQRTLCSLGRCRPALERSLCRTRGCAVDLWTAASDTRAARSARPQGPSARCSSAISFLSKPSVFFPERFCSCFSRRPGAPAIARPGAEAARPANGHEGISGVRPRRCDRGPRLCSAMHKGLAVLGELPLQGQLTPRCNRSIAAAWRDGMARRGAC